MGKVIDLGLAGPDDPIFKEGITIFTPFRPSPKPDTRATPEPQENDSTVPPPETEK